MISVGKRIRDARIAAGLTQTELAEGIVSRNQIGLIENDTNSPSLKTLVLISERLNLSISYFLSEEVFNESEFVKLRNKIETNISKKNLNDASEALNNLISMADKHSKLQNAIIEYYRGVIFFNKNEYSNAIEALEKCIKDISLIYENYYFNAYAYLSFSLFKAHEFDRSLKCIEKCEQYFESKILDHLVVYSTLKRCKAELYVRKFQYNDALAICEEYIELCRIQKISYRIGAILMLASVCYVRLNKLEQAERVTMYGYQYYGFLKDNLNKYLTLGNLGAIRFLKGDFKAARKLFKLNFVKGAGEGSFQENINQSEINMMKCDIMLKTTNSQEIKNLVSRYKDTVFSDYGVSLDLKILSAYADYLERQYSAAFEILTAIEEDVVKLNIELIDFYWALRSSTANNLNDFKEAFEALRKVKNSLFNIFV